MYYTHRFVVPIICQAPYLLFTHLPPLASGALVFLESGVDRSDNSEPDACRDTVRGTNGLMASRLFLDLLIEV